MSFALDLKAITDKAAADCDEVVAGVMVDLSRSLIARSPVGDPTKWTEAFKTVGRELGWFDDGYVGGHFRANWQLGVDVLPKGELPGVDPTGEETHGRIIAKIPNEASGHVYWFANNVPYAMRLEHGHSKQAPHGMVGLAVIEFEQIVRNRAAQVAK